MPAAANLAMTCHDGRETESASFEYPGKSDSGTPIPTRQLGSCITAQADLRAPEMILRPRTTQLSITELIWLHSAIKSERDYMSRLTCSQVRRPAFKHWPVYSHWAKDCGSWLGNPRVARVVWLQVGSCPTLRHLSRPAGYACFSLRRSL